jgi:hypothetical protein
MMARLPEPKKAITRIELSERKNGVLVEKYEEGWTAGSGPVDRHINKERTIDEMVVWLEDNHWTVLKFHIDGTRRARAFLGEPLPIRTRETILWMRQQIVNGRLKIKNAHAYDLAFWF